MATITAAMVKDLRDQTGAGMMDCKKALTAADGDMELALENLRKAGIAKAAKKADRATNEGKITCIIRDDVAVLVEVLCETDFVGKNEKFLAFCDSVAGKVADECTGEGDFGEQLAGDLKDDIGDLVTSVGENIQVRRALRWEPKGKSANYMHNGGKIGVLVDVTGETDDEYLNNLCMHIAAFSPPYLKPEDVPAEVVEKEKEIAKALPDMAGKPENIVDKIIIGRINKWYSEVCLTKQVWVKDDKLSVEKVNPKATIERYVRWQVGE